MRLNPRHQLFVYFCLSFHATLAHHPKNNGEFKTGPKKYFSSSSRNTNANKILIVNNNNNNNKYKPDDSMVKLRHSLKFPHFDQIKSRIVGLNSNKTVSNAFGGKNSFSDNKVANSDIRWTYSESDHRLRHHGWSNRARSSSTTTTTTTSTPSPEDDLFYNYGELEEEEEMDDDYLDDIFDTSNNDDGDFRFQAEEATSTTKPVSESRGYYSLSDYKWQQFGTMEKVQQARKDYMNQKDTFDRKSPEESRTTAVVEHYIKVKSTGQCKKPIPKVIPVHIEHPDPSVTYIPHCTVLHRCGEDTGCCKYDAVCQYKERVEVNLYFYVKQIGADIAKVEKLTFFNHTECECKRKEDRNQDQTTERQKRLTNNENPHVNSDPSRAQNVPESLLQKCKCPKEFVPKIKFGSKCHCDCETSNEDCLRMKKGIEYNSLVDRLCIQKKECGMVNCEYGPYIKLKGRCPRYDES